MGNDQNIINKIIKLIEDAYNPREARKAINDEFPEYNNSSKLKPLIPKVINHFNKKKQEALRRTQFFKYFLIGEDKIGS
ncbi:MAG: hypothetical protein ACTSPY_01980 [Candidatus Helarchaeota archaeon]